MGQTVYVLMMLEGAKSKPEWRPVGVVSDPAVAEQWSQYGKEVVDWVPLELDDVSYLQPGMDEAKPLPQFKPRKMTPIEQRAVETAQRFEDTNTRLLKIIEEMEKQLKKTNRVPKRTKPATEPTPATTKTTSLLKRGAPKETVPPKPTGFEDVLNDSQEIADYVETWASDYVDTDLVYENYRGTHAVLKLVPVAELEEGGRDHNTQSPANERKYQRMSIKTIPPLLVEAGKVVDGNHRFRAGQARGLTAMWCYVVIEGEVPEEEPDASDNDGSSNRQG